MTSWLTADLTSYGPTTGALGGDLYEPRTCRCGGDENTGHYGDCTWAVTHHLTTDGVTECGTPGSENIIVATDTSAVTCPSCVAKRHNRRKAA